MTRGKGVCLQRHKDDTEQDAVVKCAEKGATDCKVANKFENSGAAITTGDDGLGSNPDSTTTAAETKALATCGRYVANCKIALRICREWSDCRFVTWPSRAPRIVG